MSLGYTSFAGIPTVSLYGFPICPTMDFDDLKVATNSDGVSFAFSGVGMPTDSLSVDSWASEFVAQLVKNADDPSAKSSSANSGISYIEVSAPGESQQQVKEGQEHGNEEGVMACFNVEGDSKDGVGCGGKSGSRLVSCTFIPGDPRRFRMGLESSAGLAHDIGQGCIPPELLFLGRTPTMEEMNVWKTRNAAGTLSFAEISL